MSTVVLVLTGAALCFLGALSARVVVFAAGFGCAWQLADAFGASTSTALSVSAAAAVVALVVVVLVTRFLFFVGGLCLGAVVGAKLFVIADAGSASGHADWALALIFVPAVALVSAFLAERLERRFLPWTTAVAGAALVLSGIGRIGADSTHHLWRPESELGAVVLVLLWIGLTVGGHHVQGLLARREPVEERSAHG